MKTHGVLWSALAIVVMALQVQAEPILRYTFDDQSDPTTNSGNLGSAYDGDIRNTGVDPAFVTVGFGAGAKFTGNDHVVPMGDPTALNVGDGDFTVFARFLINKALDPRKPGGEFIFRRENSGVAAGYGISYRPDDGTIQFSVTDGGTFVGVNSAIVVNDGAFHEVHGIRNGNELQIYIDTHLRDVTTIPGGFGSTDSSDQMTIGGRELTGDSYEFEGILDEIAIFDSVIGVPEPGTFGLVAAMVLGVFLRRRSC